MVGEKKLNANTQASVRAGIAQLLHLIQSYTWQQGEVKKKNQMRKMTKS